GSPGIAGAFADAAFGLEVSEEPDATLEPAVNMRRTRDTPRVRRAGAQRDGWAPGPHGGSIAQPPRRFRWQDRLQQPVSGGGGQPGQARAEPALASRFPSCERRVETRTVDHLALTPDQGRSEPVLVNSGAEEPVGERRSARRCCERKALAQISALRPNLVHQTGDRDLAAADLRSRLAIEFEVRGENLFLASPVRAPAPAVNATHLLRDGHAIGEPVIGIRDRPKLRLAEHGEAVERIKINLEQLPQR